MEGARFAMEGKQHLFESAPVPKAVLELAVPTIVSLLIGMFYNMADTFFVGQLGDPDQVAAVSLASPVLLVLTAFANLFGIGGASLFSRSLGSKDPATAKRASAFSFYAGLTVAVFCSLLSVLCQGPFLTLLGADVFTREFTGDYVFWVFTIGAAPTLLNMLLAHFVRAEGAPRRASLGLSGGGVLNMILDPFFIFPWGLGLGVAGAAVATLISNAAVFCYFLRFLSRGKADFTVSLHPRDFGLKGEIARPVIVIGLPVMLQTLLASVSNAVLNNLASSFGGSVIAAIGIVKKVDTVPMNVTIGLAQGVMPFLAYNCAAKNEARMKRATRFSLQIGVGFSLFCVLVFEALASPIVRLFIRDPDTVSYGSYFLRVMCVSTPFMAAGFLIITLFQAAGQGKQALVLSVLRKGAVDIPLMLLMSSLIPLYGLAYVQPVTELLAMGTAAFFYRRFIGRRPAVPAAETGERVEE